MQIAELLFRGEDRRVVRQAASKALHNEGDFPERLRALAGVLAGPPQAARFWRLASLTVRTAPEMIMKFGFASYARTDSPDPTAEATNPAWSSPEALAGMHDTLRAIADLETQYEIEREQLEQSSGTEEAKERDRADLEDAHQHRCEPHVQQWAKLQDQADQS